jgi:glucosyl-3-phosphoglycerate phosphatase
VSYGKPMNNKYYILRHGQSEANIAGLLTSDPDICINNYGLTKLGKEQVTASVKNAIKNGWLDNQTIIYCSDFKRAAETAGIARQLLGARELQKTPALRERKMGKYDGKKTSIYHEIWPHDETEKQVLKKNEVEGPEEMLYRLTDLINQLETRYKGEYILLVSHGDPLQVLQASFAGLNPEQSRNQEYIPTAEIRKLIASK